MAHPTPRPLEIERKFLLLNFSLDMIPLGARKKVLTQHYLLSQSEGPERRLRKTWEGEACKYDYTEKYPTDDPLGREEVKEPLKLATFLSRLVEERDPHRAPVSKHRYLLSPCGQRLELDIYHAEPRLVIVEHEMEDRNTIVICPDGWRWMDVTEDPEYKNSRIAELILKKQLHCLLR